MSTWLKRVISISLALFFILIMIIPINLYNSKVFFSEGDVLEIKKGDSLNKIIDVLEEDFDFQSGAKLKIMMKVLFLDEDIKPGKHSLSDVSSISELIKNLTTYPKNEVRITILEGWKVSQVANYLERKLELVNSEKFKALCKDKEFINKNLVHKIGFHDVDNLEGYLYPETYHIDAYLTEEELIKIFVKEFMEKTKRYRNDINNEIMIIASIIEAETDLVSEMDTVSCVYNNRIYHVPEVDRYNRANGFDEVGLPRMRLQSDPTVLFYMSDKDFADFKESKPGTRTFGKLWRKYKNMDNPYNTYKKLMPPGPINSPRLEAIEAALNPLTPQDSCFYLFMFSKSGSKRHVFSSSPGGHNKIINSK
tara:strand:+ start:402 stop:1496 length:1095 start_codon:yes stop_codon:yes gene_type:complete